MNKWFKYIKRLRKDEQIRLLEIIGLIMENQIEFLDIKKLSGYKNLYRVRIGRYRIIFKKSWKRNQIIKVDEKGDTTYNF